jgi:hypothetical protein
MRNFIIIITLIIVNINTIAQTSVEYSRGQVSFVSSQNVYSKFDNTQGIQIGDTLYTSLADKLKAAILVKNISSISCVGIPINGYIPVLNAVVIAKKIILKPSIDVITQKTKTAIAVNDVAIEKSTTKDEKEDKEIKQRIDGKIAVSSYSNASTEGQGYQRFRYNLSLNASNIVDSKFSAETYLSFTHKLGDWQGINEAMRIYSLNAKYDISKTATVSIGRKINLNMANIGAVDGLQFENNGKNFSYGALVGYRPDTYTYGFNSKLLQYGAFIAHKSQSEKGSTQTSIGLFNQLNNLNTDRRFAYLQHSNSLLKNVDLFCSFEIDLYSVVNNQPTTSFDLTSTYISLRYKPFKKLSLSLNYDARKNVYYYETFKNIADSIFDKETRQGFRFQTTYRPFNKVIFGANAGYRLPTTTNNYSLNGYSYLTYTNIPWINASATINFTALRTSYVNGTIYGGNLSRDLYKGKIYADLSYRYVNYQFTNSAAPLKQNIGELSFSWRIKKKLMLSTDFEATFDSNSNLSGRLFLNLTQRF